MAMKGYWGVSHTKQIKNYYSSVSAGLEPDINGEEAIKTQKMICSIYESGKKRVKIEL